MLDTNEDIESPKLFPIVLCATFNPRRNMDVVYSPTHGASEAPHESDPFTKLGNDELKSFVASL